MTVSFATQFFAPAVAPIEHSDSTAAGVCPQQPATDVGESRLSRDDELTFAGRWTLELVRQIG